jgi:hypothetical protein
MANEQLIIAAIEGVRSEMNARFDNLDNNLANVKSDVKDHEVRIDKVETTILRYRTIGSAISALAAFFGYDSLKHHWTSLMK